MATAESVKTKIQGLIDSANAATGNTDADLTSAVGSLIAGYGSGGGEEEIPDDGKTRIFIHLAEGRTSPVLGCCPNGTVTVDWGDGTDPDTLTGTSTSVIKYTEAHEYAEPGDYVITLTVNGELSFKGTSYSVLLVNSNGVSDVNYTYAAAIRKVILGDNISQLNTGSFTMCLSLSDVTIPENVHTIGVNAFAYCYSLTYIMIPDSVTLINASVFNSDFGVRYYDFSGCTDVPDLANTNAFTGIASDCEMLIPAALYDEWSTATNWSNYADYMVAV